jgi:hypothetical protein
MREVKKRKTLFRESFFLQKTESGYLRFAVLRFAAFFTVFLAAGFRFAAFFTVFLAAGFRFAAFLTAFFAVFFFAAIGLVIFATTDIVDPFIQTISYECVLINIIARNYFFC